MEFGGVISVTACLLRETGDDLDAVANLQLDVTGIELEGELPVPHIERGANMLMDMALLARRAACFLVSPTKHAAYGAPK